jgi:hypothetical protein
MLGEDRCALKQGPREHILRFYEGFRSLVCDSVIKNTGLISASGLGREKDLLSTLNDFLGVLFIKTKHRDPDAGCYFEGLPACCVNGIRRVRSL